MKRKRRKAVPSAAVRRMRSPKLPRGVELFLLLVLGKRANAFSAACRRVLTPEHVATFAAPPPEVHVDAKKNDVKSTMGELQKHVAEIDDAKLNADIATAAKRVVKHSQAEFDRLGIKLIDGDPDFADMIDEWREGCVARIVSVEEDQLDKIRNILKEGFGHRVETLQDQIEDQVDGVTASRAEFIARDQVLSLNAQVTKEMHRSAGIESYVWSTSNDERVRETHAELDGQEFRWDDPPVVNDDGDTGHPGDDYLCRCVPFPVLPELEDEDPGASKDADAEDD